MKDEKKKVQILICLFVLVVCVGAFQLIGHQRPPAAPDPPKDGQKTAPAATPVAAATPSEAIKNPQVANDLPDRDPFQMPPQDLPKDPLATANVPPAAPAPVKHHSSTVTGFKPFDPLPGSFAPVKGTIPAGAVAAKPQSSQYSLVGVIQGAKPMALFSDASGNQKLVSVGASIDNETKLTGIEQRSVSIDFRGQRRRLSIGGNPVGK